MRKYPNDGSCAKLLLKKSNGRLKISMIMFLITITITMVFGLLYARQYFQYKKDFLNNSAINTVYVDASFDDSSVRLVTSSDIENINKNLKTQFPNNDISVIPVYTCMGVSINGSSVNLFAIDKQQCFFVDLDQMPNDIAYFTKKQPDTVALEISVTEETVGGFSSAEIKRLLLKSSTGVPEETPVLTKLLTPSMKEDPTCFVNMETFKKVVSVLLSKDVDDVNEVADNSELVTLSGIYVYVDNLRLVSSVSSFLTTQNYQAYAPTDSFDDFGKTVSVTFMVFLLSAVVLLCITTVNVFLSFRSFYRVQQRDIGVLRYMGFNDKRIYKMYCKNIRNKFLQIMLVCSLFVLILGMILFSFDHWIVLFSFVLALFAFLCIIYFSISRFIIFNYIKQDLLVLIRKSKEFE